MSSRTALAWLLLCCCGLYLVTASGHFGSTDEEDLLINTHLLVRQYGLGNPADRSIDLIRAPQEIGQSLLAVPLDLAAERVIDRLDLRWHAYALRAAMTLFNVAVTMATLAIIYGWVRQLYSPQAGLVAAAMYGLATLAWPYSRTFYREPLVGLCLISACWAACRFRERMKRPALLAAITCASLALVTKSASVLALPALMVCFGGIPNRATQQEPKWRALVPGMIVLVSIPIVAFAIAAKEQAITGYLSEFQHDIRNNAGSWLSLGLVGLLFSPGKGLLFTAPPVVLAVFGFVSFFRRYHTEAIAVAGIFLAFVLFYSTRRGWHGGACWGPRYLLPVLPLLMLPVGAAVDPARLSLNRVRSRIHGSLCWIVFVAGFVIQLGAIAVFPLNYYEVLYRQGVISPASLDGGPSYLREVFFDPRYSPVWGQPKLAAERIGILAREGLAGVRPLPVSAEELRFYFVTENTLDIWWLHVMATLPNNATGGGTQ